MTYRWTMDTVYGMVAFASVAATWSLMAHELPGEETTALLVRQPLPDLPGKTGLMVVVSYAPPKTPWPK